MQRSKVKSGEAILISAKRHGMRSGATKPPILILHFAIFTLTFYFSLFLLEKLSQLTRNILFAHQAFPDEGGLHAGTRQGLDVGAGEDSGLGDDR